LAVENVQGRYALDAALFSPRADFLLKVRGLSMIDAGIFDGDLLAVHKTSQARDGQIVVARLDEEVTVKRLERANGLIRLLAENPDFEPIVVNPDVVDFAIEGVAVGLIRGAVSSL
jgi:repressor LexA